jgi:hypothetical protein
MISQSPFILRSISVGNVELFTNGSLPFIMGLGVSAFFPGTNGYDCACNLLSGTPENCVDDLFEQLVFLQDSLEDCQINWNGVINIYTCGNSSNFTSNFSISIETPHDDELTSAPFILMFPMTLVIVVCIIIILHQRRDRDLFFKRRKTKTTSSIANKISRQKQPQSHKRHPIDPDLLHHR